MTGLREAIEHHEDQPTIQIPGWPTLLPPSHLTDARRFPDIVKEGRIRPYKCKVFKTSLTYAFYGGVYYRKDDGPHPRKASLYPIAFLFRPSVLQRFERYYPFDSGAMAAGRYRGWDLRIPYWRDEWSWVSKNSVTPPQQILRYFFGSNRNYVRGIVQEIAVRLKYPIPEICEFLADEMSDDSVDQRRYRVECQTSEDIDIREIIWIGYPEDLGDEVVDAFQPLLPTPPAQYAYVSWESGNPSEMAAILQDRACQFIRETIDPSI